MVDDAARRECNVGAELVPCSQPARVARRLLLRLDPSELDACRALSVFARQPASFQIVRAKRDVASKFGVHVVLHRGSAENASRKGADAQQKVAHNDSGVASNAAVMPATMCSQLDRSSRSCLRPAGVSE